MRSITEIRDIMLVEKASHAELDVLNSTSNTALWRLKIYIVAACIWTSEALYEIFKKEVDDTIELKNPHTGPWYVTKAKQFQYGYNLVPEKDYYDNTGIDDAVIAASKIIAYAALVEEPFIRLKFAKKVGDSLGKLSNVELPAAVAYIIRIKDAGVKLKTSTITSTDPDDLYLQLRIKFNPLVLDSTGARLDGTTATPVPDGIRKYLVDKSTTDFNGKFSVQKFVDAIQAIEGVTDLHVDSIMKKYGALPFSSVDIDFVPDSGYLILQPANLTITYIAS